MCINFFKKTIFFLRKPKVLIIAGDNRVFVKKSIFRVLEPYLKINKEVFIFETGLNSSEEFNKYKFFIKNSFLPILVVSDFEEKSNIIQLAKIIPPFGFLILNYDNEKVREIMKGEIKAKILSFGFQENSELRVSDFKKNGGINFKINYKGSVVPIWLESISSEELSGILAGISVGITLGLNFIEVSEALKKNSVKI